MANITLFCEGKNTSLDYKVFDKILSSDPISALVTIVPLGGKFGSRAFVDGYLRRGGITIVDKAFILRDRDFDFPVTENPDLIPGKEGGGSTGIIFEYASHRTTLENYLINPVLIHSFLSNRVKVEQQTIIDLVIESAKSIAYYSATRHALGKIRIPISLKTTWMENGSGNLPEQYILASLDRCAEKARELLTSFQNKAVTINILEFNTAISSFSSFFASENFWNEHQYLIWFHGKDLQKAITNKLNQDGIQISWDSYYSFAIEETNFLSFPDYRQFFQKLSEAAYS